MKGRYFKTKKESLAARRKIKAIGKEGKKAKEIGEIMMISEGAASYHLREPLYHKKGTKKKTRRRVTRVVDTEVQNIDVLLVSAILMSHVTGQKITSEHMKKFNALMGTIQFHG